MRPTSGLLVVTWGLTVAFGVPLSAQVQTEVPPAVPGAKPVTVERVKIHGTALEGNLEGDAVDRDTIVFLPPSYARDKSRRYPVVYALHGYSIGAEQWTREIHVPQTIEGAFAQGAKEMIVVLPDSKTAHNGSMYSSSVTTGDFERFVAHDVVAYVDAHYRTIPERASRGLVGHSMGGYGATRIGMKHPDVFGSLYIMSPCCLAPRGSGPANADLEKAAAGMKSPADGENLPFFTRAQLATAAAWSPNPKNPAALSRPADEGRRSAAGRPRQVGRERAARFRGPVRRQPPAVPRDRDGRGRSGRPEGRRRQAARGSRQVRDRERLRGVPGHSHEPGGRSLPEPCAAVLQPEPVLLGWLSVVVRLDVTYVGASRSSGAHG